MQYPAWVEEIKARFGNKSFLNFDETKSALGCSKDTVYERLAAGSIRAHNPDGKPGKKGTRIIASSVWDHLADGEIKAKDWSK